VYTQGKVGSKAVLAALQGIFSDGPEDNTNMYVWDYRRSDPEGVRQHQVVQGNRRRLLSDDPEIAQFLVDHPDRDLRLTTVVREPIAINLSSFFYNFAARNPETDIHDISDKEIVERLVAGQSFSSPSFHLDWFDIEVRPMTGIDIYTSPFPIAEGWRSYEGDLGERHTDLMTMRLEDISRVGTTALQSFYHRPVDTIPTVNAGDEQAYADRYRDFKRDVTLPERWVAWQLNSDFARNFYSLDERKSLAQRWSGTDNAENIVE
jgi:hypothetical protein